eukprot:TRINITY_DN1831_c0_g1_i3.p1 TRINITY_DN1831_c0_g1~~TRINITY_DN1831_c0_g1_i3.p1  ORF type:complete len:183 (+),score=8.71 TRINITY_DN1831_c0_g1_i3:44-550(+)
METNINSLSTDELYNIFRYLAQRDVNMLCMTSKSLFYNVILLLSQYPCNPSPVKFCAKSQKTVYLDPVPPNSPITKRKLKFTNCYEKLIIEISPKLKIVEVELSKVRDYYSDISANVVVIDFVGKKSYKSKPTAITLQSKLAMGEIDWYPACCFGGETKVCDNEHLKY